MTDTDTFKLVSKLLSQEVSHISAAGGGNSAELTQNVLLLRDSRHIEVCVSSCVVGEGATALVALPHAHTCLQRTCCQ
jgi:hypothetical protein